jgi:hypothetical protein
MAERLLPRPIPLGLSRETLRDRAERVLAETPRPCAHIDGLVRDLCAAIIDGYDAGFADAQSALAPSPEDAP